MAKMLKDVYCLVDGKTALIKTGEDAPKGDSEKLVKKGYAVEVEVKKTETKKPVTKK
jgi:hypothetical protein